MKSFKQVEEIDLEFNNKRYVENSTAWNSIS